MFSLSKSEMEIMQLLWQEDRSLSRVEIIDLTPNKTWKASSIHILLNSMLEKEAIIIAGFAKTGSHYGRTFSPAVTDAQYAAMQIQAMQSYKKSKAETIVNVMSALLDTGDVCEDTLNQLSEMLAKRKKK